MEWNPIRPHANKPNAPGDLAGDWFGPGKSHEHFCLDHVDDSGLVRAGDTHAARPLPQEPSSLAEALAYVSVTLRITNMEDVPPATAQGDLF
jgi:hypothetical protein